MDISVLTDPLSFVQSPPKGVTIPYRPKPSGSPVIFAGGQVHAILWRESVDARVWVFCVCVRYLTMDFVTYLENLICDEKILKSEEDERGKIMKAGKRAALMDLG